MLQVFIYGYNNIDNCFSIAVQQYVMLHIPFSTIYWADFAKHLIHRIFLWHIGGPYSICVGLQFNEKCASVGPNCYKNKNIKYKNEISFNQNLNFFCFFEMSVVRTNTAGGQHAARWSYV